MLPRFKSIILLSVASSGICSGTAFAQTAPEEEASAPGDIIVTARRVEERLQDVPISITVYSQDQLDQRNIVNAADLGLSTPSLTTNTLFGDVNTTFVVRGFSQDVGTQPTVGVYFGEVVSPRAPASNVNAGDGAGPGSFFDLENVQVLKGPQGTLFGRNTTGGAVLFVPAKPTSEFDGYVSASYGNYDQIRGQAVINVPLGETARARFGVDRYKRDGYLKNTTGVGEKALNDADYIALRGSLVVDLTPDLENYLIVNYSRSDITGYGGHIFVADGNNFPASEIAKELARPESIAGGFYSTQSSTDQFNVQTQWQVINKTSWTINDSLTFRNIISYSQFKMRLSTEILTSFIDLSLIDLSRLGFPVPPGTTLPVPPRTPIALNNLRSSPGASSADQYTFTEEARMEGTSFEGRFNWQAGFYAEMSGPAGRIEQQARSLLNCDESTYQMCANPLGIGGLNQASNRTRFRNYGVYAQGTLDLTDQLSATAGVRYTWDRVSSLSQLRLFRYPQSFAPVAPIPLTANPAPRSSTCTNTQNFTPPDCITLFTQRSQKPTWLLGVDYKPNNDMLLYAKYARGYRAGGVLPSSAEGFTDFAPEKVDSYEVGVKTSLLGAVRGTLNVAAFYNDFSNQQLSIPFEARNPGSGLLATQGIANAGKSVIKGFEVEGSLSPFEGLRLDASYSYIRTKIKAIETLVLDTGPFVIGALPQVGASLTMTPRNQLSTTAAYTLPLDDGIGRITLTATYSYTGAYRTMIRAETRIKPRELVNATIDWRSVAGSSIDLQFYVTNLLKEKYNTSLALNRGTGNFATVGQPRLYGARVRYNF